MKKIGQFLMKLLTNSGVSSNRFLGIFIYTPALVFLTFFNYDIQYVHAIIALIVSLLVTNAAAKFSKSGNNNNKKSGAEYHEFKQ